MFRAFLISNRETEDATFFYLCVGFEMKCFSWPASREIPNRQQYMEMTRVRHGSFRTDEQEFENAPM